MDFSFSLTAEFSFLKIVLFTECRAIVSMIKESSILLSFIEQKKTRIQSG